MSCSTGNNEGIVNGNIRNDCDQGELLESPSKVMTESNSSLRLGSTQILQTSLTSFCNSKDLMEEQTIIPPEQNGLLAPIEFKNEIQNFQWLSLYQVPRDHFSVLPAVQSSTVVKSPQLLKSSPTYQSLPELASTPLLFTIDVTDTPKRENVCLKTAETYDLATDFKEFAPSGDENSRDSSMKSWMSRWISPLEPRNLQDDINEDICKTTTPRPKGGSLMSDNVIIDQDLLTSELGLLPSVGEKPSQRLIMESDIDSQCGTKTRLPLIPDDLTQRTRLFGCSNKNESCSLETVTGSASSSQLKAKIPSRSRKGCWTCRIRHKSCPEEHPICSQCNRLSLTCDYSTMRPLYMTDPYLNKMKLAQIKIVTRAFKRGILTKRRKAGKLKATVDNRGDGGNDINEQANW